MSGYEQIQQTKYRGCTGGAIGVGLVGSAFMGIAIPYGDTVIKGSQMGIWNTNPGSIFLFFVLIALINVALGAIHWRLALDRSELAVVYIMLLVANTLPARGFSAYVAPVATGFWLVIDYCTGMKGNILGSFMN